MRRIAIARAILRNPDILIFDKVTSAPDNIFESLIQKSMEELMKTHTVIIMNIMKTARQKVLRMLPVRYRNMTRKER